MHLSSRDALVHLTRDYLSSRDAFVSVACVKHHGSLSQFLGDDHLDFQFFTIIHNTAVHSLEVAVNVGFKL